MKSMMTVFLFLSLFTIHSRSDEGGSYYIPVDSISTDRDIDEIAKVFLKFEGKKAEIFRKSLPPITTTYEGLNNHVNEIVFVDEKTKQSILISCSNAKLNQQMKLEKLSTTKCSVRLMQHEPTRVGIQNDYGDAVELTKPVCGK